MADPSNPGQQTIEAQRRYVGDMFTRIVPRYDLMNTLMTGGMHHRWRNAAARIATKGLEGEALDVASGTGDLTFALAASPGIHRAVGLDLLPEMLIRGEAKSAKKKSGNRTSFVVGDALSLPYPDDSFICATSAWGLRNMPDLRRGLEEMVRVAKPGGRVVSLESMPVRKGLMRVPFRLFFHLLVPLLGQLVGGDRAAYTYLPRSVERFFTPTELVRQFEMAGLKDVGYLSRGFGAVAIHWGTVP